MRSAEGRNRGNNSRGVALLIALLITTLLMALIMEFAYGTRVSLRAAVNFRDGQRAYYLARSGVNFAGKILAENLRNGRPQNDLERREPECKQPLPYVSTGDVVLQVCWEDEAGKISLANLGAGQPSLARLEKLFEVRGVGVDVLDRLKDKRSVKLLGELHQLMSDEEFMKINDAVSVYAPSQVNINTASVDVLQSLGISASSASMIKKAREENPFVDKARLASAYGLDTTTLGMLDVTSNVFRVHSHATVGGYTKKAEAVIMRNIGGFNVLYWMIL